MSESTLLKMIAICSDQEVNCNMLSLVKRGSVVRQLKRKIEVFKERLMKAAACLLFPSIYNN